MRRLERIYERVRELEETNLTLGTRGARLGIVAPEIHDVQVEAIIAAALAVEQRRGTAPLVEIMLPLVAYEQEVQVLRDRVERAIATMAPGRPRPLIGTMIELPRACFVADRIAGVADFFSSARTTSRRPRSASRATTWSPASSRITWSSGSSSDPRSSPERPDRRATIRQPAGRRRRRSVPISTAGRFLRSLRPLKRRRGEHESPH